jgi:tRNA(Ile)-lysidine synthase
MFLLSELKRVLANYAPNIPITLGYSGGLDSTVLLHMLVELKEQGVELCLRAIHIHHGLSVNADSWVDHCQQTCDALNVTFEVAYADLKPSSRTSLEQLAREARYHLLDTLSDESAVLLTAQHQDDQAETLLLQLLRGAGPKGLSAMSVSSKLSNGRQVLRPLLSVTRMELEEYAKVHRLDWIEDESNRDDRFDRNFLRNQIAPILKSRWPNAAKTISRSAALCGEQQALVESEAFKKLRTATVGDTSSRILHLSTLEKLTPQWFNQVIRLWLREWQVDLPSANVMQQIYQQTFFASNDAQVNIQLSGAQLKRYNHALYLVNIVGDDKKASFETGDVIWDGVGSLYLPNVDEAYYLEKSEQGFCKTSESPIVIKFGCLSVRFKYEVNRPSKLAKQWFKEWKIPPWERKYIPFFYCDSQLVQIGDKVNLLNENKQGTDFYCIKCKV